METHVAAEHETPGEAEIAPELEAEFEAHYFTCPECLDKLSLAESMRRGFKRAASEEVARRAATRRLFLLAWLTRLNRCI